MIDIAIVEKHLEVESRMHRHEFAKPWHDVEPREGDSAADSQPARERCGRPAGLDFRFVGLFDRPLGVFVESFASFRRC